METILAKIVNRKKQRLKELKENSIYDFDFTISNFEKNIDFSIKKPNFYNAMKKEGLSIIGEVKKASPSKGIIRESFNPIEIAKEYNNIVDAMSILTEENFFMGKAEYLKDISNNVDIPLLRKDFIIDPIQIYEAKYLGASAILLIVSILSDDEIKNFYSLAKELELDCLVEIHNLKELNRALNIDVDIIGINNRNLKDFSVSLNTTLELSQYIEKNKILISESGIFDKNDIKHLKKGNIDGILVGESFMKSSNINHLAKSFKKAFEE
ncbi:indole-3-glycerol phosphate synthase [Hypnocyclicus thermotrophus]|uniref:Indole-3-glycerol phosphate synthase n=1 Tax=Hypnocyclicus thermotrophus TaxID=1627895 RepID=A0AA46DZQ3_9FUSO|nr:indole-3-glycerol phosphate synthase TrpC [Hypnocyclicus thermotrophus]TDT71868.1 indole-3-glycerol phosphate synthase [Hypnocyclicus thermotrophus]